MLTLAVLLTAGWLVSTWMWGRGRMRRRTYFILNGGVLGAVIVAAAVVIGTTAPPGRYR